MRALAKLERQLETLDRSPDAVLRRKILHSLHRARSLVPSLPWVPETGLTDLLRPVTTLLQEHQQQEALAIRGLWKQLLRDDSARQRAFVKARADAQLEFEKQQCTEQAARTAGPVHPSLVVRAQATEWLQKWQNEPSPNLSAIDKVLERVTPIPQLALDVQFDPDSLKIIAASLSDKAAGPDSWKAKDLSRMPRDWWYAVSVLGQHVWNHGAVPRLWRYPEDRRLKKINRY